MPDKKIEKLEPVFVMKSSRMHMGEAKIRWWYAVPEQGTPYERILEPTFWNSQRDKLQIGDFIMVEPDEGHYTAELKVQSVGIGGVRVAEYYKKPWATVAAPASIAESYRVKFAGPHHKWRVERIEDGHVEQAGFTSESDANRWLIDNTAALSRNTVKAA